MHGMTHRMADTGTLFFRMRKAVPEPALAGLRAMLARRLADRTLDGASAATTVLLALNDRMANPGARITEVIWGQTLLLLEACISDAPAEFRTEALDRFGRAVLASGAVC